MVAGQRGTPEYVCVCWFETPSVVHSGPLRPFGAIR